MPKLSPRVATALIGIPIVALIIWAGGWVFWCVVALLAFLSLHELQMALRQSDKIGKARLVAPFAYPALLASLILALSVEGWNIWAPRLGSALPIFLLILAVLRFGSKIKISLISVALTLLAVGYVGLFAFLPLLRALPNGAHLFWLMIVGVWAGDTAAYYAGRAWGKTKLSSLSPGKTREGILAGAGATLGATLLLAGAFQMEFGDGLAIGVLVALAAPLGDLAESFWKRELGVKDLGAILPGHGGVLDRCDSLLFAASVVYFWASWALPPAKF